MPPSSTISGSEPPPAAPVTNPAQCGTSDCINHVGCFTDMAGGVAAVPTPALKNTTIQQCFGTGIFRTCWNIPVITNSGWTALKCAAEAKKNGGSLFAIQVGMMGPIVEGKAGLGLVRALQKYGVPRHCNAADIYWAPSRPPPIRPPPPTHVHPSPSRCTLHNAARRPVLLWYRPG